nr:MAG TPA: protein of unknown function DUF2228 [Caudoviricetes sp.]
MAYTQSSCGCTKPEETGNRCPLRKIKSIAKSGDYVIVTFDDCTFLKASFNVVDDTFGGTTLPKLPETDADLKKEVDSLKTKVEELGSKEDKDTIFDPIELVERTAKVEARVKALEDTPASDKVDVTAFVRKDELVDVQDFEGNTSFRAIPAEQPTPRRPEAA